MHKETIQQQNNNNKKYPTWTEVREELQVLNVNSPELQESY